MGLDLFRLQPASQFSWILVILVLFETRLFRTWRFSFFSAYRDFQYVAVLSSKIRFYSLVTANLWTWIASASPPSFAIWSLFHVQFLVGSLFLRCWSESGPTLCWLWYDFVKLPLYAAAILYVECCTLHRCQQRNSDFVLPSVVHETPTIDTVQNRCCWATAMRGATGV